MTQYRIVQRTNKYSITTFVIQHCRGWWWRDIYVLNKYDVTTIAEYRSLIEAKEQLEILSFIPPEDVIVYRHWK
tara:strand:+ start:684 stop:905 length:222 start_codon:yes stop_codon:yes gene_type:complete